MVKFYLRLIYCICFIVPFSATAGKEGGDKSGKKTVSASQQKKTEVRGFLAGEDVEPSLEVFKFDPEYNVFLPALVNSSNEGNVNKMGMFDPVRFRIEASQDSIIIGKEIELKIIAEYLDVNPQLMFSFEEANEFTLNLLVPMGFIITGGDYHPYIQGRVDKTNPRKEFIVRGHFESDLDKCFMLLRSHKTADINSFFVKKAAFCFNMPKPVLQNTIPQSEPMMVENSSVAGGNCPQDGGIVHMVFNQEDLKLGSRKVRVRVTAYDNGYLVRDIRYVFYKSQYGCNALSDVKVYAYSGPAKDYADIELNLNNPLGYNDLVALEVVSITGNYWDNSDDIISCSSFASRHQYDTVPNCPAGSNCSGQIISDKSIVCNSSNNATLSISNPDPYLGYVSYYQALPGGGSSLVRTILPSMANPDFKLTNVPPGSYYAELGASCKRTSTIHIRAPSTPTLTASIPCNGTNATLTAQGCPGSYVWSGGGTGSGNTRSVGPGVYFVNCAGEECSHSFNENGSNAVTINSINVPPKPIISKSGDFCNNTLGTLTVINCNGGVIWSNGNTGPMMPAFPGTYTATCTNSCGTSVVSDPMTVSSCDPVTLNAGTNALCTGKTTFLKVTQGCYGQLVNFEKKNGESWTSIGTASQDNGYIINGISTGTYQASCGENPNKKTSLEVKISSSSSPEAPIISADRSSFCGVEVVTLNAKGCQGGIVKWSNEMTGAFVTVKTGGAYHAYCVTVCDNTEIQSPNSASLTVAYQQECPCSAISLTSNDKSGSIEEGQTLELNVPLVAGISYTWSTPQGQVIPPAPGNILRIENIKPFQAGEYKVTVAGCASPLVFTRNVSVVPIDHCGQNFSASAGSTSPYGEVSVGEKLQLYASGGDTYEWTGPGGFYSPDRWPVRESVQTWHSGTYNVKINRTINGQNCSTTIPVQVQISSCRLDATPHFVESATKFTLYVESNVDLAQGVVKWFKNGLQISQGRWHELVKNDANRGEYKMVVTYQTCTVEKSVFVDYSAPPAYVGNLNVTSCDKVEGWIVDENNKSKSLQYTIRVKIDNDFYNLVITTAGNGASTSFSFDIPYKYKDGLKHTVIVYDPAGNPILNTTNRSFRCCSLEFEQTPVAACSTSTAFTITSKAVGGTQYRFRLDRQDRNESGDGIYTQVTDWTTISASGTRVFTVNQNANYKVTVRDGNDADACKTSVVVPVVCGPVSTDCAPPVVTVFPAGQIREGQGITPKFYANAIPFNQSVEKGGLILGGSTALDIGDYSWLSGNLTMEALVNPDREAITVGDISESGRQRYLFRSWFSGNNGKAYPSLSVGSNGINLIEEGYNFKRLVLSYEGTISGWNHIAVVYSSNKARLYINGSLVKSSETTPPMSTQATGPYAIGSLGNNGFRGSIYALRVWATPLEGTMLAQLKNNFIPVLAADPNVGFWLFDKPLVAGKYVEDLSTHKRKAYLNGNAVILPPATPAVSPEAPRITWWLNGVQVGAGESYSMPREKVRQGTLNYTAKYQKSDGSYCQTTFPVVIEPILFGGLSGCYIVRSSENNHPMTPYYSPGDNHYRIRLAPQQPSNSEQQIWNFEHLGNEVYRINSAFYTDMALENDGGYYLKMAAKQPFSSTQKFKAVAVNAGQMQFAFRSESETTKMIRHYANDYDPFFMWTAGNDDAERYKLTPVACPLPPTDCNVNGKITYERWLQPGLQTMTDEQFDNIDIKAYMQDNPASYVSMQNFGGFRMNNDILNNLSSPPKPNNWPDPDRRWLHRMSGFFCPPQNGDYYFFTKTYEWAELWISTDEDPRNKKLVSSCYGFSQDFDNQRSAPFAMSKGRSYYFELVFRQNGGGMMAEVAMVTPGNYYLDYNHQPMPLTNFSSIPRDLAPGFLTISPNKPKVAPTENVTIAANGCYYGRIVWRAGTRIIENASATIPSITETGPGIYQAICVGDPTVVQDWVTVTIDPITDIVPIPAGPAYACTSQNITLTGTSAPAGYTYKWYVLKPGQKEYFFTHRSSTNLFENAPQIFNITNNASVNVTGPGLYWLQCISPNGWRSQVREFKVDTVFNSTLRAANNGPIEDGNTLTLSTGVVPAATSYAWTGPQGFTASTRIAQRPNFSAEMAGKYILTITATGGCTFRDTTEVAPSGCEMYVESKAAGGEETFKLTRIGGQMSQFQPLTLTVLPYTGTNTFNAYTLQWMHNGSAIAGATGRSIQISKPGEYRAVLTLKSNPQTICEAVAQISAEPCKVYELDLSCQVPNNITLPNAVAAGVQLGVGDEFTAGDYTVVVTEIISGSPAGWKGKGYVKLKAIAGIVLKKVSVNFENAVVNECYELASGSVVTDYDPSWGGVLDIDGTFDNFNKVIASVKDGLDDLKDLYQTIFDRLEVLDCSQEAISKLNESINGIQSISLNFAEEFPGVPQNQVAGFQTNLNNIYTNLICKVQQSCPSPNARVQSSDCGNPESAFEDAICEISKSQTSFETTSVFENLSTPNSNSVFYYTPSGILVSLPARAKPGFGTTTDLPIDESALVRFELDGQLYFAGYEIISGKYYFSGYFKNGERNGGYRFSPLTQSDVLDASGGLQAPLMLGSAVVIGKTYTLEQILNEFGTRPRFNFKPNSKLSPGVGVFAFCFLAFELFYTSDETHTGAGLIVADLPKKYPSVAVVPTNIEPVEIPHKVPNGFGECHVYVIWGPNFARKDGRMDVAKYGMTCRSDCDARPADQVNFFNKEHSVTSFDWAFLFKNVTNDIAHLLEKSLTGVYIQANDGFLPPKHLLPCFKKIPDGFPLKEFDVAIDERKKRVVKYFEEMIRLYGK